MNWIKSKTIIITGASSGIGRALTLKLIKEYGCFVIGVGKSHLKMETLKNELSYYSDNFKFSIFDVADEDSWEKFAYALKKSNFSVDILINCAGTLPAFKKFIHYSDAEIREVFETNFYSCMYSVRYLLPLLFDSQTPGIVNISCSTALASIAGTSIYSASKAAMKSYTESLMGEFGRRAYIAYVCPGFTRTDIFRNQYMPSNNNFINFISSSPEYVAGKIIKKISRQRARIIVGKDAKIMNFLSKVSPVMSLKFYETIMKLSKAKMFEDIF